MSDLGNANWSETAASNNAAPPNGWPENMNPSDVNNSARETMAAVKRWWNQSNAVKTSAGSTTAFTLTYDVAAGALYDGEVVVFVADRACVASATMNKNGLGAKAIVKATTGGTWAAVANDDWAAGHIVMLSYDLANTRWKLLLVSIGWTQFVTLTANNSFTGTNLFAKLGFTSGSSLLPQGRLCLFTAEPVPGTTARTGKTVVYYSPYVGDLVPIYDGTQFYSMVFAELSNDLTASSTGKAGPAAAANNSNYDLFVWNDSGTLRLTRGPLWTSDSGRGTGAGTTELERILGIWTNKVAITNGPGANLGTYVGTIRTDGSAQANWQPGAVAAGGTAALLNVWNAYNRVSISGVVGDSTASWTYTTATWRSANNSAGNRVSFVVGLQEEQFVSKYRVIGSNSGANFFAVGIGIDSTSALSGIMGAAQQSGGYYSEPHADAVSQLLGFHYHQAIEWSQASGTTTWTGADGTTSGQVMALRYQGRF